MHVGVFGDARREPRDLLEQRQHGAPQRLRRHASRRRCPRSARRARGSSGSVCARARRSRRRRQPCTQTCVVPSGRRSARSIERLGGDTGRGRRGVISVREGSRWVTTATMPSPLVASSMARRDVRRPTRMAPAVLGKRMPRRRGRSGSSMVFGALATAPAGGMVALLLLARLSGRTCRLQSPPKNCSPQRSVSA